MKKAFVLMIAFALAACLCAQAETLYMSGEVVSLQEKTVTAAYGGTVSDLYVAAGDRVSAGGEILKLQAQPVVSAVSGTVYLFGEVGDDAAATAETYGSVAYVEQDKPYRVSATTSNAYNDEANRIIHPGEKVYLRAVSNATHKGAGYVSTVSGTSYTVVVEDEVFSTGEAVYVFRSSDYAAKSRLGRGSVSRADAALYTGEGIVTEIAVENGAHVEKGDVLFYTLSGTYSGKTEDLTTLRAAEDGTVATVSVGAGSAVESGAAVCTYYPDGALYLKASVSEYDIGSLYEGAEVTIEYAYAEDGEKGRGTVEKISLVGEADETGGSVMYSVYIRPEDAKGLRYGMTATAQFEAKD